jgi:hypothetical protein
MQYATPLLAAISISLDAPFVIAAICALVVSLFIAGVCSAFGSPSGRYGNFSLLPFMIIELVLIPIFIFAAITAGCVGGAFWSAFLGWAVVRVPAFCIRLGKCLAN